MRRKPPPGCITATLAIERIGKSLYKYIEKGEIHPQGPSTLKHKWYLETEIARIEALENSAFEEKLHKLPARFDQAKSDDIESLYNLAVRIFGGSTITPEKRRAWLDQEPRGNYVVRRNDTQEVVSYFYVQSLSRERILEYMKECRGSTIRPDEIRKITPGTHEMIIAGIGRDPRADKQYVAAILHGFSKDLERWGHQGIDIKRFYAYSETIDGIFLSISMGMKLWKRPRYIENEGPFFTFMIDVDSSDIPLLRPYKRALAAWKLQQIPVPTRGAPVPLTTQPGMPEGLVGWRQYCRSQGINESTIQKAIETGRVNVIRGPWKVGRSWIQDAIDEEGRAQIDAMDIKRNIPHSEGL